MMERMPPLPALSPVFRIGKHDSYMVLKGRQWLCPHTVGQENRDFLATVLREIVIF